MTSLQTINTVCTAQIVSGLPYDGSSERTYQGFKNSVKSNLDYCSRALVVNVLAFGIATQTKSIEILKEVFGFKEVHNSHNYKYPEDSKRLVCLIKDMNDYKSADLTNKVTNPFAASNEAPRPSIWDSRTRDPEALRAVGLGDEVVIRRLRSRYNTDLINGELVLNGEVVRSDPFPINRWVEIPNDATQVPLLDTMNRVSMLYSAGRGAPQLAIWSGALTQRRLRNVIEEYQRAGLRIVAIARRDAYSQR